jgi:transposase
LSDAQGRPCAFLLTPGNIADISVAPRLLTAFRSTAVLIGDKGYDANSLRVLLKARETKAVIPSRRSRNEPFPLDREAYRQRNVIERIFCRLKDFRRIATRYDKLACNFLAGLCLAAVVVYWARWAHHRP